MKIEALAGWVVASLLAAIWWWRARRAAGDWAQLRVLLETLSKGQALSGLVFRRGGKMAGLTHALDKLADEHERLRRQISDDTFNLQTILASMEEGVLVVDAQHRLRLVNPSLLGLFDIKGNPLGQTALQTLRESAFEEMIAAALRTGEAQTRELKLAARKQAHHLTINAVPIREPASEPGVVLIVRDVSRLKQLEEVRRDFVANVSHELRTPLSIFQGYLENLVDEPTMPRKAQAEIFEILRKHSQRLNALLEDLLHLARLESRHAELQRQDLQLAEIIPAIGADWAAKMQAKNLTLSLEVANTLPSVSADRFRIEQVLHNLLENAVKYTGAGGRITLGAGAENGSVVLRVADTGAGIPPADLPHIFERFYRADKSRTREQGGTGLGLSIVKHIVQLHGGSVAAESKYGRGTAILIRLPRNSPEITNA